MAKKEIQNLISRIHCVKYCFEDFFMKLAPPETPVDILKKTLKDDHCCIQCNHECVIHNDGRLNKPTSMKLLCKECGCEAKDCQAEKVIRSWIVFNEISKIQAKEVEDFIVNKVPLKGFPHCKTTNQLLSAYMQDAVKTCSRYLLNKNQITETNQLDSQMHARMIFTMPAKILRHSFPEVKFNTHFCEEDLRTLAHQVEGN